jgi:hypothetical protein
MGIIAKDNGGDFEPVPLGIHRAICINVFDIGYQPGYQGAPPKHQVVILWEIEARQKWEPNTGKRFTVTKFYTLSINAKSNLGQDLESWRTKPFSEEELEGFDLDNIIGKRCQLNLVANGEKAKVAIVLPKDNESEYWTPETARDFVPKFIDKKREESVPEPKKRSREAEIVERKGEGFNDDIPF